MIGPQYRFRGRSNQRIGDKFVICDVDLPTNNIPEATRLIQERINEKVGYHVNITVVACGKVRVGGAE